MRTRLLLYKGNLFTSKTFTLSFFSSIATFYPSYCLNFQSGRRHKSIFRIFLVLLIFVLFVVTCLNIEHKHFGASFTIWVLFYRNNVGIDRVVKWNVCKVMIQISMARFISSNVCHHVSEAGILRQHVVVNRLLGCWHLFPMGEVAFIDLF